MYVVGCDGAEVVHRNVCRRCLKVIYDLIRTIHVRNLLMITVLLFMLQQNKTDSKISSCCCAILN